MPFCSDLRGKGERENLCGVTQICNCATNVGVASLCALSSTCCIHRLLCLDPHDTSEELLLSQTVERDPPKARLTDLAVHLQVNPKDISIDADLEELSAVVTYVVETTYLDTSGAAVDSEKVNIRGKTSQMRQRNRRRLK